MHRLAWWLDRKADDLWNIDEFLDLPIYVKPTGAQLAADLREALEDIEKQGNL
jgi:hypothetical protein